MIVLGMTLIQAQTLSASATSVTFGSIPQTFKTLKLVVSARNDWTGDIRSKIDIKFNGISTETYLGRNLIASGSSVISQTVANSNAWGPEGGANSGTYTASTFSSLEALFPNYATSQAKVVSTDGVVETNATNNFWFGFYAGSNSGTGAISSLSITNSYPSGSNFVAGSSFYLYGIK